jgi:hypothetical protein
MFNCPCALGNEKMGKWTYSSTILQLRTRKRTVIHLALLLLYLCRNSPWYPLYRRLGELQSQSGCHGEEENNWPLPEIKT